MRADQVPESSQVATFSPSSGGRPADNQNSQSPVHDGAFFFFLLASEKLAFLRFKQAAIFSFSI